MLNGMALQGEEDLCHPQVASSPHCDDRNRRIPKGEPHDSEAHLQRQSEGTMTQYSSDATFFLSVSGIPVPSRESGGPRGE